MAILIVEHNGAVEGTNLCGRILIGRRSSNHVVIDHPDVSRIHAWIDTADQAFCIIDAGSRTGTFVNGHRVTGKLALRDGDRMTVGPASLIFRAGSSLPAGVSQLDFGSRGANNDGILFDCTCGAPLWISSAFAGRMGKCRFCGAVVQVPKRQVVSAHEITTASPRPAPPTVPPPALRARTDISGARTEHSVAHTSSERVTTLDAAAPTAVAACGACQSAIEDGEPLTSCPSCGLTFHTDCWTENYGCSAYGCSQVNVLAPAPEADPAPFSEASQIGDGVTADNFSEANAPAKLPAGHLLLAGSVGGILVGLFTFGIGSVASLAAILMYFKRHPGKRADKVILAAAALSVVGIVAGVGVSYVWWLGGGPGASREGQ